MLLRFKKVLSKDKKACGARDPESLTVTEKFFRGVSLHRKNVIDIKTNIKKPGIYPVKK